MRATMRILLSFVLLATIVVAPYSRADDKSRQRLEELFIWKVSDYLQLSPEEDTSFRKIVRELNEKKAEANEEMRKIISQMEKEKLPGKKALLTKDYKQQLKIYSGVATEEIEKLSEVLGEPKLADYIIVKAKLTENLKVLMNSGESFRKPAIGKPKVEIEK